METNALKMNFLMHLRNASINVYPKSMPIIRIFPYLIEKFPKDNWTIRSDVHYYSENLNNAFNKAFRILDPSKFKHPSNEKDMFDYLDTASRAFEHIVKNWEERSMNEEYEDEEDYLQRHEEKLAYIAKSWVKLFKNVFTVEDWDFHIAMRELMRLQTNAEWDLTHL